MWFDEHFENTIRRLSDRFFNMDDIFESDRYWDDVKTYGPYYYGYQIAIGNDGKPIVREYGNVKPSLLPTSENREPFVDQVINNEQRTLKLVAEMPGVEKKDMKITVEGQTVHIKAEHERRKYETKIHLQKKVDENSVRAVYANGILELTFKIVDEKLKGRQIAVE